MSEPEHRVHSGFGARAGRMAGEAGRYTQLAALSAGICLGVPLLLHEGLAVPEAMAVATALGVAFIVNFFAARVYVFRSGAAITAQLLRFAAASAAFRVAEYAAFFLLYSAFEVHYVGAVVAVLAVSFVVKFVVYRAFVFAAPRREVQPGRYDE